MPQRDAVLLGATRQGSDGRVEGRLQSSVAPGATPAEAASRAAKQAGPGHAPGLLAIIARFGHQNQTRLYS